MCLSDAPAHGDGSWCYQVVKNTLAPQVRRITCRADFHIHTCFHYKLRFADFQAPVQGPIQPAHTRKPKLQGTYVSAWSSGFSRSRHMTQSQPNHQLAHACMQAVNGVHLSQRLVLWLEARQAHNPAAAEKNSKNQAGSCMQAVKGGHLSQRLVLRLEAQQAGLGPLLAHPLCEGVAVRA